MKLEQSLQEIVDEYHANRLCMEMSRKRLKSALKTAYAMKRPLRVLAAQARLSEQTIMNWLHSTDIQMRPKGRPKKK